MFNVFHTRVHVHVRWGKVRKASAVKWFWSGSIRSDQVMPPTPHLLHSLMPTCRLQYSSREPTTVLTVDDFILLVCDEPGTSVCLCFYCNLLSYKREKKDSANHTWGGGEDDLVAPSKNY